MQTIFTLTFFTICGGRGGSKGNSAKFNMSSVLLGRLPLQCVIKLNIKLKNIINLNCCNAKRTFNKICSNIFCIVNEMFSKYFQGLSFEEKHNIIHTKQIDISGKMSTTSIDCFITISFLRTALYDGSPNTKKNIMNSIILIMQ